MNRSGKVLAIGATALAVLTSTGGAVGTAAGDESPVSGGSLSVGLLADAVGGLDPHKTPNQQATWVNGLVYGRLVNLDEDFHLVPELATEWSVDSPTQYTFHLRDGVTFHDGSAFTANDVVVSLERLRNPDTGSARSSWFANIETIEAPDELTVVLTLSAPDASLLNRLASPISSILSDELLDAGGDPNVDVVGTGPFVFVSHTPGVSVELDANRDYYEEGLPYLDHVSLRVLEDENTRLNAMRAGDLDIATFIPVNLIDPLSSEPNLTVNEGRSGQFYNMSMNIQEPPFDDVRVRQAIQLAIDRDLLVESAIFGKGVPLNAGPIPAWHDFALDTPVYEGQDLEAAQALLDEAGFEGASVTMGIWSGQTFALNAAQIIQEWLRPLGFEIEIQQYGDYASYNQAVFLDQVHPLTIQGYGGKVDPADWVDDPFRTDGRQNFFGYSNPEVDRLLDAALATPDFDERKAAYDEAQRIVAEEGPLVFLWNMEQPDALGSRVRDYQHRPDLRLDGLVRTWVVDG